MVDGIGSKITFFCAGNQAQLRVLCTPEAVLALQAAKVDGLCVRGLNDIALSHGAAVAAGQQVSGEAAETRWHFHATGKCEIGSSATDQAAKVEGVTALDLNDLIAGDGLSGEARFKLWPAMATEMSHWNSILGPISATLSTGLSGELPRSRLASCIAMGSAALPWEMP